MNIFYKICVILIIIGGINWGLIGLFSFDAVAWLLGGSASLLSRAVSSPRQRASAAVFCRSNFSESPSRAGFPVHIVRRALYRNPTFGI